MIALIDHYDSFIYNIRDYILQLGHNCNIYHYDKVSIDTLKKTNLTHIILSPGPKHPNDAAPTKDIINNFEHIPILGICLGHQIIGQFFGADIIHTYPKHGVSDLIYHENSALLANINTPFTAARYHSLSVSHEKFPDILKVTAYNQDKIIMAIEHKIRPIYGVQFHPESILTPDGKQIIQNFLNI